MEFLVSIDGKFSPLQVEKLKHEILNMRGVVSVEWQEVAEQSAHLTAFGVSARAHIAHWLTSLAYRILPNGDR